MGHLQSSAETGHLLHGDNGHLAHQCVECENCDSGKTPTRFTMTVATNIVQCPGHPDPTCLTGEPVVVTYSMTVGGFCAYEGSIECGGETWEYTLFLFAADYLVQIKREGVGKLVFCADGSGHSGNCIGINDAGLPSGVTQCGSHRIDCGSNPVEADPDAYSGTMDVVAGP